MFITPTYKSDAVMRKGGLNLCSPDLEFGVMNSQRDIAYSQMPRNLGEISRKSIWFQGN